MTDHEDNLVNELLGSLDQLEDQTGEFQALLARSLQALSKRGVQLSVNLDGMVREIQRGLFESKKKANAVIEQIDQQHDLMDTIALITSSLDVEEVLNTIMDRVIHLTGAERVYLMLDEGDPDNLAIKAARNWDQETISEDEVVFSRTMVKLAQEKQEAFVTDNAQADEVLKNQASVLAHGLRAVVVIPLAMHGRIIGVLYADNSFDEAVFTESQVPLLTAFGTQAAIAIQNARQFEQVQTDLVETKRELEVLRIQIDEGRVQQEVADITEAEFFENLYREASRLRRRKTELED